MPSGRIFRFIGFNGTENANKVCTRGPKKLMIGRIFVKVIFGSSGSLDTAFSIYFLVISVFSGVRRERWTCIKARSNTVSGKIVSGRVCDIFGPFALKFQFLIKLHTVDFSESLFSGDFGSLRRS